MRNVHRLADPPATVPELERMLVAIVEIARIAYADRGEARSEHVISAEVYLLRRGLVEPTELFPIHEGRILAREDAGG